MSQIGRYEIVGQTGNHGLGSLYQAFDPVMHRPVMIRIADRTTSPGVSFDQARQAILFDAKQLAHLDHPNIIKFLACEEDDGRPYLVMERFEGKPLNGVLPPDRLFAMLKKAALALDHANSRGLIHRNLTPESLLLDEEGALKVMGFEIARPAQFLNAEAGQDLDLLLDSIHYMSPELVKGDSLDARSDQYSLGVIAWQALTGSLPFRADSPITLLANIAFEPPELRGTSDAVRAAFQRVFSKNPEERFGSATEFVATFQEGYQRPQPAAMPLPVARLEEKKSLLPWILAAAAIAIVVIAGAIFLSRPHPKLQPAATIAPAPEIAIPPPPPPRQVVNEETPAPVVKAKAKAVRKQTKDTTPAKSKLKPIDPKVVHP